MLYEPEEVTRYEKQSTLQETEIVQESIARNRNIARKHCKKPETEILRAQAT